MPPARRNQNLPPGDLNLPPEGSPTPSRRSRASSITSASVLATKPEFQQWASMIGLNLDIKTLPSDLSFDEIKQLHERSFQFPKWLGDEKASQFKHIPQDYQPWVQRLCTFAVGAVDTTPSVFEFHDEEDPELSSAIGTILQICHHNRVLRSEHDQPTESDRRIAIDNLVAHVCETNRSRNLLYSTEQKLNVCKTKFENVNVTSATPDGVIYLKVSDSQAFAAGKPMRHAASAFQTGSKLPEHLKIIHCVAEYKRDNASGANQAIMGMVSGIVQKRVLRVPGQFVFGIFHHQKDFLRVIAARQENIKINLYDIGEYSLDHPPQMVQFYLLLRGIKLLSNRYLNEIEQSDLALALETFHNPPPNPWVTDGLDTISEHPSESGGQPQHGGGTNSQLALSSGLLLFEPSNSHHRVLSYLENISDLSTSLPVEMPPSPHITPPVSPPIDPTVSLPMKRFSGNNSDYSDDEFDEPQSPLPSATPAPLNRDKIVLVDTEGPLMFTSQMETI